MIVVGLTGSIAMGKTTAAGYFAAEGVPVFAADAAVHEIYGDSSAIAAIAKAFPTAIVGSAVDRQKLAALVLSDPQKLKALEALIHPLVRQKREKFVSRWKERNCPFVVLDIPLLFETGEDKAMDYTIVVSAPPAIQRARALARPGMTAEKLANILARQMPDAEKRKRADFILDSSGSVDNLQIQVRRLVEKFRNSHRIRGA
jgi:dephospho-CoA kinase